MTERLLDHQQVKIVQLFEMILVAERVCGISINGKQDLRIPATYFTHDVDVPAGFDLEFDTLITIGEILFDAIQELSESGLYAEADTHRNASTRATYRF